jgi:hypothetical protein
MVMADARLELAVLQFLMLLSTGVQSTVACNATLQRWRCCSSQHYSTTMEVLQLVTLCCNDGGVTTRDVVVLRYNDGNVK